MATIRERVMPSGEKAWIVTFIDNAGNRKTKNFAWIQHGGQKKAKKKAEMFLAQATVDVRDDVYVHAPENPTIAEAAPLWCKRLEQREAAGELERATRTDWEAKGLGRNNRVRLADCVVKWYSSTRRGSPRA